MTPPTTLSARPTGALTALAVLTLTACGPMPAAPDDGGRAADAAPGPTRDAFETADASDGGAADAPRANDASSATDAVTVNDASTPPAGACWGHRAWIHPMYTDFYYSWTPAERDWAAAHFDMAMSGQTAEWKSREPRVRHIPYALDAQVIQPSPGHTSLGTEFVPDMTTWYAAHADYQLEDAFLHTAGMPRTAANRVAFFQWTDNYWALDPGDPGLRAYQLDRIGRMLGTAEDGIFFDVHDSSNMHVLNGHGATAEYATDADYDAQETTLLAQYRARFPGKLFMLNTSAYEHPLDAQMDDAAGGAHTEQTNNPLLAGLPDSWPWVQARLAAGDTVEYVAAYTFEDHLPGGFSAGNYPTPTLREKVAELASYYMAMPDSGVGCFYLDMNNHWTAPPSHDWLAAQEYDPGAPMAPRVAYAAAPAMDPNGHHVRVFARDYQHALVLLRTPGAGDYTYSDYSDATAVTVPLPGEHTWHLVQADGTVATTAITHIALRNTEAAILVRD